MKKIITIFTVILAVITFSPNVLADGMIIPPRVIDTIQESGQKAVIWYKDGKETLILSTTYKGNTEEFVWVIPVPSKPEIEKSKDELFTSLEDYTKPAQPVYDKAPLLGGVRNLNYELSAPAVNIVETKRVDIYDTAVLEANDANALQNWLKDNGYDYPENKRHLLEHYIQKQWYFVVAKINASALGYTAAQLKTGHATPLSITFDSPNIVYPLKISGLGAKDSKLGAYSFESGYQEWSTTARQGQAESNNYVPATKGRVKTVSGEAYHGDDSLLMTEGDIVYSSASAPISLTNKFEYGSKYVLSGYIKVKDPQTAKIYVSISNNSETLPITDLADYSDWKRFELPFTYNNYGGITIQVQDAGSDLIYLDAVQVEKGISATEFTNEKLPTYKNVSKPTAHINPDSPVTIVLYVFADKKQSLPGFNTEFADDVKDKEYKNFALKDNGDSWIDGKGKMFLTKLTNTLPPSQMVDDLILRDASDQTKVNAKSLGFPIIAGLFLLLLVSAEMIIALYFWKRYSNKRKGVK